MSEEEKHAIEFFNKVIYQIGEEDIMKNNCILLNLINRLQKENEELKEELEVTNKMLDSEVEDCDELEENSISKEKIRNKIKEIEEDADFQAIEVLYELLGE